MPPEKTPLRIAGLVAHAFINSKLTPLFIAGALLAGAFAVLRRRARKSRRSSCPCWTSSCSMPGATPAEVRTARVRSDGEAAARGAGRGVRLLDLAARPEHGHRALLRGTKEEDAIVKTYNKLYSNFDRIPQGVSQPLIKVRSIDDVPILALTLWGEHYDAYQLRADCGRTGALAQADGRRFGDQIIGGLPRQVRVVLDTQRLRGLRH